MSVPIQIIAALQENPYLVDEAAVLADWCEECGFTNASFALRGHPASPVFVRALASLNHLVGGIVSREPADSMTAIGRYDVVLPFRRRVIYALEEDAFEIHDTAPFILRRIVFARTILEALGVSNVRVGDRVIIDGGRDRQVPGSLFDVVAPDLFDRRVAERETVRVDLINMSTVQIDVAGCVLGIRPRAPAVCVLCGNARNLVIDGVLAERCYACDRTRPSS